jgi:hypothetical protein
MTPSVEADMQLRSDTSRLQWPLLTFLTGQIVGYAPANQRTELA